LVDDIIISFPCAECGQPTAEPDVCPCCASFICYPCLLDRHPCTKEEGSKIIADLKKDNNKCTKKSTKQIKRRGNKNV